MRGGPGGEGDAPWTEDHRILLEVHLVVTKGAGNGVIERKSGKEMSD